MTATQNRPSASANNEWLPDHCPPWCEGGHAEVFAETENWTDAQKHHRSAGGGSLSEIRNQIDGRIERPGGGGWNLHAEQTAMPTGGYLTVETIHLHVDAAGFRDHVTLALTTGEARVLARQLEALADRLDLT